MRDENLKRKKEEELKKKKEEEEKKRQYELNTKLAKEHAKEKEKKETEEIVRNLNTNDVTVVKVVHKYKSADDALDSISERLAQKSLENLSK